MALNVNRAVTDPFYRYKMPKLLAKVEGKGNGIKTVIANMSEIAKSLERPPMYPTKYFGCELGAQTNFDAKNERYIVNGEHDANKLQEILDGFIKKFVLCPACDNPETTLTVRKQQINSKCKACGHAFVLDNKHKLHTFIIRNPPKIEVDFSKHKEPKNGHVAKENGDGSNGDKSSNDDEEDDDDWAPEPVGEEAKLTSGIGKLVLDKDLDKSLEERLDMLHQFIIKMREENQIGDGKVLADEAERLDVKQKAGLLMANELLNEHILKENQLAAIRKPLLRITLNDKKAQRYFLGGIEQLIIKHKEALLPKSAHIVKAIYDNDIVEEETLLAWGDKPSSKYVSKTDAKKIIEQSEKVLTWLREASEDEEESDEEDEKITFDDRIVPNTIAPVVTKEVTVKLDDGQEIDIDDI